MPTFQCRGAVVLIALAAFVAILEPAGDAAIARPKRTVPYQQPEPPTPPDPPKTPTDDPENIPPPPSDTQLYACEPSDRLVSRAGGPHRATTSS